MITKTTLTMTQAERSKGRFMRAPDHPGGEGGEDTGGEATSSSEDQTAGEDNSSEELTTEEKLEQEFGVDNDSPATDNEEEEGESEEAEGNESEVEKDKPKTRNQQRIDDLVKTQREAEADAAFWKRRAEELGANSVETTESATNLEEPDVSKFEFGEADLDYITAKAKFDAKLEVLSEQAEARLKSEAASLEVKWTANVVTATETYPDFDEVVVVGAKEGKWHCPPVIALGIKDSEEGTHIAYKLAKDPAESERLAKLSPLEQARMIGRMERDIFHERTGSKLEKPKPTTQSKAPTPPKKRINGAGNVSNIAADTDDFAAFERMADARLARK